MDEEFVAYYLDRKINGRTIELEIIPEVDLYKCEPRDFPRIIELQHRFYIHKHNALSTTRCDGPEANSVEGHVVVHGDGPKANLVEGPVVPTDVPEANVVVEVYVVPADGLDAKAIEEGFLLMFWKQTPLRGLLVLLIIKKQTLLRGYCSC
ncbi:hypothetical protein ACFX2J_009946 [Malus domestica]|uniref:uncharacterized protein n=1 Tax=Malus domestica TaxID=3750 RepID=UPI0039769B3E